jgi:hypothetical protein
MSKVPPQGSSSIPQILNIIFGHGAKVRKGKRNNEGSGLKVKI